MGRRLADMSPDARRLNVLQVVSYWGPQVGGPVELIGELSAALRTRGHAVTILAIGAPGLGGTERVCIRPAGGRTVDIPVRLAGASGLPLAYSPDFVSRFRVLAERSQMVCIHGLWRFPCTFAAAECARRGIPYVVFTHNMLTPWSLAQKPLRKKIYWNLFEKNNLDRARAVFVMREDEFGIMDRSGIRHPDRSVYLPRTHRAAVKAAREKREAARHSRQAGESVILYLGRIHPKKGLVHLIGAMPGILAKNPDARLIAAGPVEDKDYMRQIRNEVARLGLDRSVTFAGAVAGKAKEEMFCSADLFVLPSADDKPLTIPEALSYGIPVVASPGCGWPQLDGAMGLIASPDPEALVEAVNRLLADPLRAEAMGRTGHDYVLEHLSWDERSNPAAEALERLAS